ncbi:MAG: hypothetical protein EBR02_09690 [Alphaproteobacteria bacterium]|nr:hypothetical protein [Alphaproteobacteria bacterium]
MIKNFRHKGLQKLYEEGVAKGIEAIYLPKIRRILAALEAASSLDALNAPSFRLHPLKGDMKGLWSVTVGANWRIVFRFDAPHVYDVDLTDYH